MKFQELPKFVINLESRPDRLEDIKFELEYVGWDFELFNAINRNSYMGCTLSHLEILRIS
jgi:GR25 family glycosyltransferase involved in LPS biosynthesis